MADERLEVELSVVEPITKIQDVIDIVNHAMESLQPKPGYPAGDKQLVFNELATILDFLGVDR